MKFKKILCIFAVIFNLTGCVSGQCINGPCALEHSRIVSSIKPYGAHWIKEGMTASDRKDDYIRCGGGGDLREGYDKASNQSVTEFFKGFNSHVNKVLICMKSKGYTYIDQCDARCMYP